MAKGVKTTQRDKSLSAVLKAAFTIAKPRRTITDVADKIGTSFDVLSNVLNGRTKPDTDLIERLRIELHQPKGWPYSALMDAARAHEREGRVVSLAGTPLVEIPVVGKVAAGHGEHNVDPDASTVWVPEVIARMGGIGWIVEGDSMMPDIMPGDVLTFAPHSRPKRGFPMLLRTEEREDKVKIIDWGDGSWIMRSRNPRYDAQPLDSTQILGLLVGFYRYGGTKEVILTDPEGLTLPLFEK